MLRFLLLCCLSASPCLAQIAERDLRALSPDGPESGKLVLQDITIDQDRVTLSLQAQMPALFNEIDQQMRGRGNLGDCRARLYWRGPTRMLSGGPTLRLRTRIEWELWLCTRFGKTIIADSTHDADLTLSPDWDDAAKRLHVEVRIDNIHDFRNDLERFLNDNGVPFSRRFEIPLGDPDVVQQLGPTVDSLTFARNSDRGATLAMRLSANRTQALIRLQQETGWTLTTLIGETANRFGRWFLGRD